MPSDALVQFVVTRLNAVSADPRASKVDADIRGSEVSALPRGTRIFSTKMPAKVGASPRVEVLPR